MKPGAPPHVHSLLLPWNPAAPPVLPSTSPTPLASLRASLLGAHLFQALRFTRLASGTAPALPPWEPGCSDEDSNQTQVTLRATGLA